MVHTILLPANKLGLLLGKNILKGIALRINLFGNAPRVESGSFSCLNIQVTKVKRYWVIDRPRFDLFYVSVALYQVCCMFR